MDVAGRKLFKRIALKKIMRIKPCRSSFLLVAIFLSLIPARLYAGNATPQVRAAQHLEFIHNALHEMHPAALEKDATEFHRWHKEGYAQARKLLAAVNTTADELALLRFYLAGYKDSHIGGHLVNSQTDQANLPEQQWTGWILKATSSGYRVAYSKQGANYPPENAQLLSCNQQAIDLLLQQHYSPYLDQRWHLLKARDKAAKALSQQRMQTSVLKRPALTDCTFLVNNSEKIYPFAWEPISATDITAINAASNPRQKLPGVSEPVPGTLWVTASNFSLDSKEELTSQQQLIAGLQTIEQKKIVVIDVRGNTGGNSSHGFNILNAILTPQEMRYVSSRYDNKNEGANALFRASWPLYHAYEKKLQDVINSQGESSSAARYLKNSMAKIKTALDNGAQVFYQFDIADNKKDTQEKTQQREWNSALKVVLLTSNSCSSACLDLVDALKFIPNLVHLGEPTDADTAYMEIAHMQSQLATETFHFSVPVKKWNKRLRNDNEPYIPDSIYTGNIYDDRAVEGWTFEQIKSHTPQLGSN